jgi:thiosulfate/3-mercaptopyruvate sulfurtransferase
VILLLNRCEMRVQPLVGVKWLSQKLLPAPVENIRVTEAVMVRSDKTTGRVTPPETYMRAHLPHATYMNVIEASNRSSPLDITVPSADQFAEYASKKGISNEDHVVIYDCDARLAFDKPSTRIWWLFNLFGHSKVSILDGGMRRWAEASLPVTDAVQPVMETDFKAKFNQELFVDFKQIKQNAIKPEFQIVDVRSEVAFNERTFPAAKNLPIKYLYNEDGTFKNEKQLNKIFKAAGVDLSGRVVGSCNAGMMSTTLLFACALLQCSAANYDGSWQEYQTLANETFSS